MRSFRPATNGSTVVYRRQDLSQSNLPTDLSFVRTADPATQVRIQLPNGMKLLPTVANSSDDYVVSPDGQWIGAIAAKDPPGTIAVILVNVAAPTVIHTASAPDATAARQLQFSSDSQHLYFLAGVPSDGFAFALYRTAVATADQSTPLSVSPPAPTDDVMSYAVSADQSRILLNAKRAGVVNLYYVNPANPRNEIRLNHALNAGDQLFSTAFQFGNTVGGSPDAARVGYSIQPASGPVQSYIAEVSASPNARVLAPPGLRVDFLRPDNAAALLETESLTGTDIQTFEKIIDSANLPTLVGDGFVSSQYDATGNAMFMTQFHDPPQPVRTTGSAVRPGFGTTQPIGTPGQVTLLLSVSAADRGVALFGEAPSGGAKLFRMALVNAWAPDKLLYLTDFLSTQALKGGTQVLTVDP